MYDGLTKRGGGGGGGVSQREKRRKLCTFSPVVRGEVAIKEGGVRPCDRWTGPLISCLDDPLQASPSTGQRWLGGDEGGRREAGSGKFHSGLEDGGKVRHYGQHLARRAATDRCVITHMWQLRLPGGGVDTLKNTLGMRDGGQCRRLLSHSKKSGNK